MSELISVIVPIYKVEQYLNRCVDSIINQTYKNLEIILVDDGSPDNCPAICDEYEKVDTRIKVIHKKNGGLSDARNAGLAVAAGEWISFIDSDDWIEPDMYASLIKNAIDNDAQISVGGVNDEIIDSDGIKILKTTFNGEEIIESLSSAQAMRYHLLNSWAAWDKIYRRDVFKEILFPIGEINEDEVVMLKLLDRCERIVYTNRVFYHYIHRPQSITTSTFSAKKLVWIKHCIDNLAWVIKNCPENQDAALIRLVSSILWGMREMALDPGDLSNEVKAVKAYIKQNYKMLSKAKINIVKKARLFCGRYVPFSIYRLLERLVSNK